MLKQKDLKRVTLIEACIKGQCTVKQVATALGEHHVNKKKNNEGGKRKQHKIHSAVEIVVTEA